MNFHFFKNLFLSGAFLLIIASCTKQETASPTVTAASDTATYRITFQATWTSASHPTDYPSNPHFSGLIGMSHGSQVTLYKTGENASAGIKNMAETGSKGPLDTEINAFIQGGTAFQLISGDGVPSGTASVSVEFKVTQTHSLVSIVSMLAPSPDWFVGISGVNLYENGAWITSKEVNAGIYDAGTDNGTTFTSANLATSPFVPVTVITDAPLAVNGTVATLGTFKIEKI